nr:hypothetical protein MFLOJ_05670 [Mycobacterium florentinum]
MFSRNRRKLFPAIAFNRYDSAAARRNPGMCHRNLLQRNLFQIKITGKSAGTRDAGRRRSEDRPDYPRVRDRKGSICGCGEPLRGDDETVENGFLADFRDGNPD